jgi:shikimate dehydrogenase
MVASVKSPLSGPAPDLYGVVGHPIDHSLSPFIHGMFAKETKQNLVYRLFDVEPARFRGELLRLFTSGLRGMNVTVPHKQAAAEIVNELTPRAALAAAVNTIALRADATLLGDNTDGVGLTRDIEQNLGAPLAGKKILILGAGGATRGVIAPLLSRKPALLLIANRTENKAHELAAHFATLGAIDACGFENIDAEAFDFIINATSASLHGTMPELPRGIVGKQTVCYDLAYGPGQTPFMLWAKAQDAARALKGYGMLVEQAAESFELWRGVRPNIKPVLAALARKG